MFYPMLALFLLTIFTAIRVVKVNIASVKSGQVSPSYFKLMRGENPPEHVVKTVRCFNNLFEMPVLFYTIGVIYIALGVEGSLAVICAWCYVISRCALVYIHLGYNNIRHRMRTFGVSSILLMVLWGNVFALKLTGAV